MEQKQFRPTDPLPLSTYEVKCIEDMVRLQIQKDDEKYHRNAPSYFPPLKPQEMPKLRLTEAVKTALRWDVGVYISSFAP